MADHSTKYPFPANHIKSDKSYLKRREEVFSIVWKKALGISFLNFHVSSTNFLFVWMETLPEEEKWYYVISDLVSRLGLVSIVILNSRPWNSRLTSILANFWNRINIPNSASSILTPRLYVKNSDRWNQSGWNLVLHGPYDNYIVPKTNLHPNDLLEFDHWLCLVTTRAPAAFREDSCPQVILKFHCPSSLDYITLIGIPINQQIKKDIQKSSFFPNYVVVLIFTPSLCSSSLRPSFLIFLKW